MPLPKFDELFLPLLKFLQDGNEHSSKDAIEYMEKHYNLSENEKNQLLPSGRQRIIVNRTGWARTFLKKAEFLQSPRRGYMQITKRGSDYLKEQPQVLTLEDLKKYPEFELNWGKEVDTAGKERVLVQDLTPEERIEEAFEEIKKDLAKNVLEQIASLSPAFFERLVVDLLLKMGYGGSFKDAGSAIGKNGDGGIDGIIKEDMLGLDVIYLQAKRWEGTIGRPEIQKFMGALAGNRAKKGVFITTSSFTTEAIHYVASIETKIVLIDGKQLAEFMIEYNVGVSEQTAYIVKRIDGEYFSEA